MTTHDPNPAHVCMCDSCRSERLKPKRSRRKQSKFERGYERYMANGGSFTSNRKFDADNGTVDGQPAYIERNGDRTDAYSGPGKGSHIVTNDGVNASYVRNDDETVVVDDQSPDPYNPRPWRKH